MDKKNNELKTQQRELAYHESMYRDAKDLLQQRKHALEERVRLEKQQVDVGEQLASLEKEIQVCNFINDTNGHSQV